MGFVVCSWDEAEQSKIALAVKSPRELTRAIGVTNPLPQDIRPFLLEDINATPWGDLAFNAWMPMAFRAVASSISSEIGQGKITFGGPPRLDLETNEFKDLHSLTSEGFVALQNAARWIYELERESEIRHRIFVHEFARIADRGHNLAKALSDFCSLALDGARITYQYGLHEQSKDAIKSLSELRKAIVDETSKMAETTRQLALNTAGALFYGLGLVAGKLVTNISPWILDAMSIIGAIYLAAIVAINSRFLTQQNLLRKTWRQKLYRYLTESEYNELVKAPIGSANLSLRITLWCSTLLGAAIFSCVVFNNHSKFFDRFLAS